MKRLSTFALVSFFILHLGGSLRAEPRLMQNLTLSPTPAANIHEVNTMLAFAVIDFALTAAATSAFYYGNGRSLCTFGKSQAIPLANSFGLLVSSIGARATLQPGWTKAAAIFSSIQGVINLFRSYIGIWYHFIGGESFFMLPEKHAGFQVVDGAIPPAFSLCRFLSPAHHRDVAKTIFETLILSDSVGATVLMGIILIGVPAFVFLGGVVQLAVGLAAAI